MRPATRSGLAATAGYSLVELMVAMGIFTVVMGATMGGLASVMKGNELVHDDRVDEQLGARRHGPDGPRPAAGGLGTALQPHREHPERRRSGADTHSGPSGTGAFQTEPGDLVLPAVMPRAGAGPDINGVPHRRR